MLRKVTVVDAVRALLKRGWMSVFEVRDRLCDEYDIIISESATSARIRDLRKVRYGGHEVATRRVPGKNYVEYKLKS